MPEVRTPQFAVKATTTQPTLIKPYPSKRGDSDSIRLSRNDLPLLVTRMDFQVVDGFPRENSHYEIELAVPYNGQYNWYAFHEHVEKVDLPEFFLQATDATVIKRRIDEAANLSPEDRFNFNTSMQPLQAEWIRPAGASHPNYLEFSLKKPVHGYHNWFAFTEHVAASKVDASLSVS